MNRSCACAVALAGLAILLTAGCAVPSRQLSIHPASSMVRIGGAGGTGIPGTASSYRLEMVRNEREGFQFAVLPPDGKGGQVCLGGRVHVGIRAESQGAPEFSLYQVLAVNHVAPPTSGQFVVPPRHLGLIPDVLVPSAGGRQGTFALTAAGEVPLTCYVEFHTTDKTVPGTYRYTIQAGDKTQTDLRVVVDVRAPVLPGRLPFRTATMWNWSLEDYYGRPLTSEEKKVFWNFFLDQRLSPNNFFGKTPDPSPSEAAAAGLKARGLSVMNLTFVGGKKPKPLSDEYKAKMGPQLKRWREQLQQAGLLDTAVILLADEPQPGTADLCRRNAAWFKEQFPEVKIWVATRPAPEWDFADVFDVVTANSTDFYKAHSHTEEAMAWWRHARPLPGGEYWWFHSVEPYAPYTNLRLDNLPIEARVAGWQSAVVGVDGYEYFWMTDWSANKDTRDLPWPARAAAWKTGMSGAGTLCYPDEHMRPMPSLRLVNLRDGLEDWALLEMLSRNGREGMRQAVSSVTKDLLHYTTDPQVILDVRSRIIAALSGSPRK